MTNMFSAQTIRRLMSARFAFAVATLSLSAAGFGQEFRFEAPDGSKFDARLVEWTAEKIVIADRAGQRQLSPAETASFESRGPAKPLRAPIAVQLVDGSSIRAVELVCDAGECAFKTVGDAAMKLPATAIASVRLREPSRETDNAWRGAVDAEDVAGDRIVIRREATTEGAATVSLDYREGIVKSIGAETVDFEREGRILKVKRDRLEGIVFFRKRPADQSAALGRVDDIDGDQWTVASVKIEESGAARIVTPAGATIDLPLAKWKRVDLSESNAKHLTTADGVLERPLLFPLAGLEAAERQVADVGDKPSFDGRVRMGDVSYTKAFQLPAQGSAVFLTTEGMKKFQALVGFDDAVTPHGTIKLVVELDGKVAFERSFGPAREKPTPVTIELNGAQRVSLRVEQVSGGRFGARLTMAMARFTR